MQDIIYLSPSYRQKTSLPCLHFLKYRVVQRTLDGLSDMFRSARSIMKWLADCAALIGKQEAPVQWVTPLGLPVVQPYRRAAAPCPRCHTPPSYTL